MYVSRYLSILSTHACLYMYAHVYVCIWMCLPTYLSIHSMLCMCVCIYISSYLSIDPLVSLSAFALGIKLDQCGTRAQWCNEDLTSGCFFPTRSDWDDAAVGRDGLRKTTITDSFTVLAWGVARHLRGAFVLWVMRKGYQWGLARTGNKFYPGETWFRASRLEGAGYRSEKRVGAVCG